MGQQHGVRSVAVLPLLQLAPGTVGVLRHVLDEPSRPMLRALGLTAGVRVQLRRIGNPCIIQVGSTRIGLSKDVAQLIFVTIVEREGP